MSATIAGAGSARTPADLLVRTWEGLFGADYADAWVVRQLGQSVIIGTRHGEVTAAHEDVFSWGAGAGMPRFHGETVAYYARGHQAAQAEGLLFARTHQRHRGPRFGRHCRELGDQMSEKLKDVFGANTPRR